jgi:hypothetical protein
MALSQFEMFEEDVAGSTNVTRTDEVAGFTGVNLVASNGI